MLGFVSRSIRLTSDFFLLNSGNFGLPMEKLGEWNAMDNTLVIFMTDMKPRTFPRNTRRWWKSFAVRMISGGPKHAP